MYQLIGATHTRAGRVLWMLEELGVAYEHISEMPHSSGVLAVNPAGKIPVLMVDGTPILDSTAMLTYLADHHGALTHPAGSLARAQQDSLTHFLLDEFDSALWVSTRHSIVLPEDMRVPAIKPSLHWEFERSQKALVQRMGDSDYLMGDMFTVPDIILTACLGWAEHAKFPLTQPRLTQYLAKTRARPAYQRVFNA